MHWWSKALQKAEERQSRIWLHYWDQMKQKIERGEAPDCFARQFVQAGYLKKGIDELQAAYVCGSKLLLPLRFKSRTVQFLNSLNLGLRTNIQ
jgi:hypothetical protein